MIQTSSRTSSPSEPQLRARWSYKGVRIQKQIERASAHHILTPLSRSKFQRRYCGRETAIAETSPRRSRREVGSFPYPLQDRLQRGLLYWPLERPVFPHHPTAIAGIRQHSPVLRVWRTASCTARTGRSVLGDGTLPLRRHPALPGGSR